MFCMMTFHYIMLCNKKTNKFLQDKVQIMVYVIGIAIISNTNGPLHLQTATNGVWMLHEWIQKDQPPVIMFAGTMWG